MGDMKQDAPHTTDKVGEALVEQVDRDALADHLNPLGEPEVPGSWVYSVRNGDEDSYSTLQLLARHRLAALASSRAEGDAARLASITRR